MQKNTYLKSLFVNIVIKIGFLLSLLFISSTGMGQNEQNHKADIVQDELVNNDSISEIYKPERSIQVFPTLFFTPETNFGVGFTSLSIFKLSKKHPELQYSNIQFSGNYSLNKQISIYTKGELNFTTQFLTRFEIGYFHYPDVYSGIGNDHDAISYEKFDAYYPRIKIDLLRRSKQHFIYGLRYWYQNTTMPKTVDGGILETTKPTGYQGSVLSGIGVVLNYDSRNFIFAPTKGWYSELSIIGTGNITGGTFQDQQILLDIRKYTSIFKTNTLAFQFTSEVHFGSPAFNHMAILGGEYSMRGYRYGVFRDESSYVFQSEFRSAKFFKFFALTTFGSIGGVAKKYLNTFNHTKFSYGFGLWVYPQPKKRLFIRFDYGRSLEFENSQGFYVSMGNAF